MPENKVKVGIISCSGEELPEGTISRLATRRVLELIRPESTVTICLPLFVAGDEAERGFAAKHPTITVDGCEKRCAKIATEELSGAVSASIVVSELIDGACGARSAKSRTEEDRQAVWLVSEEITREVDKILAENDGPHCLKDEDESACACLRPIPAVRILVGGKPTDIAGLALIFEHLRENGVPAEDASGDKLLDVVRIYHQIGPEEEDAYKAALISAYKEHRRL